MAICYPKQKLEQWTDGVEASINLRRPEIRDPYWEQNQNGLPWRVRRVIGHLLESIGDLDSERQRRFARCSILSVAQWALDCKSQIPAKSSILSAHRQVVKDMLEGNAEFRQRLKDTGGVRKDLTGRLLDGRTYDEMPHQKENLQTAFA
jgi:hypothetical protein